MSDITTERGAPPDVFVIVLDAVSFAAFNTARELLDGPERGLIDEVFETLPRTITPSPWSVPSHQALLTGTYPWVRGTGASPPRSGEVNATLAGYLKKVNYHSFCLSANAFLAPHFGLTHEFDYVAYAKPWEPFIRVQGIDAPSISKQPSRDYALHPESGEGRGLARVQQLVPRLGLRIPYALFALNRLIARLKDSNVSSQAVSSWIDSVAHDKLTATPSGQPLLGVINLMEAHDPYFPVHGALSSDFASIPQDPLYYIQREASSEDSRLHWLRAAYVATVGVAIRRALTLVEVIRSTRGLDNSFVALTSDHGQAFMEDGVLFHGLSVHDEVVRVPLLLHWPKSIARREQATGWTSLIDLVPTVLDLAGVDSSGLHLCGHSLIREYDYESGKPVVAVADGIQNRRAARLVLSRTVFERLDATKIAAYKGEWKGVFQVGGAGELTSRDFRSLSPHESAVLPPSSLSREMEEEARRVSRQLSPFGKGAFSATVQDRLATWGYS